MRTKWPATEATVSWTKQCRRCNQTLMVDAASLPGNGSLLEKETTCITCFRDGDKYVFATTQQWVLATKRITLTEPHPYIARLNVNRTLCNLADSVATNFDANTGTLMRATDDKTLVVAYLPVSIVSLCLVVCGHSGAHKPVSEAMEICMKSPLLRCLFDLYGRSVDVGVDANYLLCRSLAKRLLTIKELRILP
jgi:hypothetical protein